MRYVSILLIAFCAFVQLRAQPSFKELASQASFQKLAGTPLADKYGNVAAVKVVYDLKKEQLYYLNARIFKYHHEFCVPLGKKIDFKTFNLLNYSDNPEREYLLGDLNYFSAIDRFALSISSADEMSAEQIILLHTAIKQSSFIAELHFFLNTNRLLCMMDAFGTTELLLPAEVYSGSKFQAIATNKGEGRLKFIQDLEKEASSIAPTDIVVLQETPLYLPAVAGIIVTEFQTPLSHISLLGRNRKIPICAWKDAFEDEAIKALDGSKVSLQVRRDTFTLKSIDEFSKKKKGQRVFRLDYDLSVDHLVPIESLSAQGTAEDVAKASTYLGNKAANFGALHALSAGNNFQTPEQALAIPFYFYAEHIKKSSAQVIIDDLPSSKTKGVDEEELRKSLATIQEKILSTPIDADLICSIEDALLNEVYHRFRFRSSTNAEDAKGFSGAGLYTSKTGILHDEVKSFERAIQQVYASLWSYEAFQERALFNINHHEVFMGVLVHRSFPSEDVNGVAITKNIYRPYADGFVINAQVGNESVVAPSAGVTCDQYIVFPDGSNEIYSGKNIIDIITKSSFGDQGLLMSPEEIHNLAKQLELIKRHYFRKEGKGAYHSFGLDLEFKLDGPERTLYIKQVRRFND